MDDNGTSGINKDVTKNAVVLRITVFNGKIYIIGMNLTALPTRFEWQSGTIDL